MQDESEGLVNSTISLLLLIIVSFLLASSIKKLGARLVFMSAGFFIFFGVLLGPFGFSVLNTETLAKFDILLSLIVGVLGFYLGVRVKKISQDREHGLVSGVSILMIFLFSGTIMALVSLGFMGDLEKEYGTELLTIPFKFKEMNTQFSFYDIHLWVALTFGACAISASSFMIEGICKAYNLKSMATRKLRVSAILSQAVSVLVFGLALSFSRAVESAGSLGVTIFEWAMIAIFSGVFCGLLFSLFIGKKFSEDRFYLASIGAIIFASGVGKTLGVSPLFVNFVFGVTVSWTSVHAEELEEVIGKLIEPIYVLILLFAGTHWVPVFENVIIVIPLFIGVRYLAFRLFYRWVPKIGFNLKDEGYNLGLGLLGQDLVVIAIALSFYQRFPQWGNPVLTVVIFSTIANQFLGMRDLNRLLVDSGDFQYNKNSTGIEK